jgi:hypothetical protein
MKQTFLFFILGILILSCSKEKAPETIQNDRLQFRNMQEFNDTYVMLSKMSSKEELQSWADAKKHSNLLNSDDSSIEQYSDVLKTILNKDSEYELDNSIIWFNNGQLYAFSKSDEPKLKSLKSNTSNLHKVGSVNLSGIDNVNLKSINLGLGRLDARNQKQFTQQYYQPCGGTLKALSGNRKYVHEIYDESYAYDPGPVIYSYLHLRIKLEWKGSGGWKAAGEQREIRVNVSGTANMYPSGVGGAFNIPNYFYDCSGNLDFVIMSVTGAYPYTPSWTVSMSGSIYQKVKGDVAANAWTNSGILW